MKRLTALILAGALLLLPACAGQKGGNAAGADLGALAEQLLESQLFEETLNPVEEEMAEKLYSITGASSALLYVGSGASADELALFEFEDEETAQDAAELARARVADQRESFAGYIPEEVPKLDAAVVKSFGRCLVVCVSAGDGAEEIISDFFEQEG